MCFLVEGVENKETCVVLGTWGCLLITYGEYTYHKTTKHAASKSLCHPIIKRVTMINISPMQLVMQPLKYVRRHA